MQTFEGKPIISDQIESSELGVIMRELREVLMTGVIGDIVELGCYEGTTSLFLQRELLRHEARRLYLYDSFAGLPEKSLEDISPVGEQFKAGELLASKQKLILNFKKAGLTLPKIKKAWFDELVPTDLPEKIAFAFLDGDYHGSITTSLKLVWPKLSKGAVVIVDDYANEALPGTAKAVDAWLKSYNAKLRIEQSLAVIRLP